MHHAGPFRESTGHTSPAYFKYYIRTVGLLGIGVPLLAIIYLTWRRQAAMAFGTLGLYLLELWAQIRSERMFIRKGELLQSYAQQQEMLRNACVTYSTLWRVIMRGSDADTSLSGLKEICM